MGVLRNTVTIVDGGTIADANVIGPQQRIRDFTNGQVGAENLRADAGISLWRTAQPVSRVIVTGSIHSLQDTTRRVLLHIASPAYFKGKPSELKLTGIHAYTGEHPGAPTAFTVDARCWSVKENRWTGPDGTTANVWGAAGVNTGQTIFTNAQLTSQSWNTYNAVLPRISNEDYSMLQISIVMSNATAPIRGIAVYVFAEASRLP